MHVSRPSQTAVGVAEVKETLLRSGLLGLRGAGILHGDCNVCRWSVVKYFNFLSSV